MIMLLDRAIVEALYELLGDASQAFFLRVRDMLVDKYGFSEQEANAIINAYLDQAPESGVDLTHITGDERMSVNGFKVVRFSIINVIDDLLGDENIKRLLLNRISRYVKQSFSIDLEEAVKEINADVHGEPIESVSVEDDKLRIKLKRDAYFVACLLAHIRADNPVLESKEDHEYVFKKL